MKAEKKAKKARAKAMREENKNAPSEIIRKIVLALSIIVIIASTGYLAYTYLYQPNQAEKLQDSVSQQLSNSVDTYGGAVVDSEMRNTFGVDFPNGMLAKYAQLFAVNNDLKGWVRIPELGIDFPVVQGKDNDY
jgi:sortase B